ncbi:hypothetical protein [Streptomyces hypolithicus]
MGITISLVALFGLVLFFLLRGKSLGFGSAFIAVGFGFFLASTGASGPINGFTTDVITSVRSIDF